MYMLLNTYVGYVSSGLRFYQLALSLTSLILYFIHAVWLLIYRPRTRLMGAVLSYTCFLVTHIQSGRLMGTVLLLWLIVCRANTCVMGAASLFCLTYVLFSMFGCSYTWQVHVSWDVYCLSGRCRRHRD